MEERKEFEVSKEVRDMVDKYRLLSLEDKVDVRRLINQENLF